MNSKVAYPFTKSDRERDKIMSEVQLSKLHLALVDKQENVIISTYDGTHPRELLLHGYYFILDETFSINSSAYYIYVESDVYDDQAGKEFPELLQSIGGTYFAEHECIFNVNAKSNANLRNALGLTFDSANNLITDSGSSVLTVGGNLTNADGSSDFIYLDELFAVYYLADEPNNKKKKQIWIKTKTDSTGITVLNPHIYLPSTDTWVPLGAVYKERQ